MTGADIGQVQPERRSVLRPVIGLTKKLSKADLEQITVEAIKKHRRLGDRAEAKRRDCVLPSIPDEHSETVGPACIAYIEAMIEMHAQQAVLSTLLDVLGYIPEVPAD